MFSSPLSITNMLICIWVVFLMILYIFNIVPIYGIAKVGSREYLSVLAFVFVFFKYNRNRYYITIMLANWAMMVISIITALVNGTGDYWYVLFGIRNILYVNGALFIASFLPNSWTWSDYIRLIIIAIIINSIIAVIAFFSPVFQDFLLSFQSFSNDEKIENTISWSVRMMGVGSGKFFVGGIINGMGIILTFYLLIRKEINGLLALFFLFLLFFIGVFIARTTIIGFGIGLLFYVLNEKSSRSIQIVLGMVIVTAISFAFGLFDGINTSHAFEFFTTDVDSFRETQTMESLSHMYSVKYDAYTLFIGDGVGSGYYQGSDVGWLRNILYFGIFGTVFGYLYYEIKILRILCKLSREKDMFFYIWLSYLVVLNFKGLPDFNFMILLLIAYYIKQQRQMGIIKRGMSLGYTAPYKGDKK